jgi:hypothetical protein
MERMSATSFICSASRGKFCESCTPGAAVSIALVGPPVFVPGFGSNVSSWLGPPLSQSTMTDVAWPKPGSALLAPSSAKARSGFPRSTPSAPPSESLSRPRRSRAAPAVGEGAGPQQSSCVVIEVSGRPSNALPLRRFRGSSGPSSDADPAMT